MERGTGTRKKSRPTPSPVRNVHLQWSLPFADRVDAIVAERGMTKQEIILRVMHQAIETNLLYEWILKPVTTPQATSKSREEVSTHP